MHYFTFDQSLVNNQCLWLFKPVSLQGIFIFIDAVWLCQKPSLGVYHSCGSPLAIYCWVSLLPSSQFQYEWSVKVLLSFWVREFHNLFAFFNLQVTNLLELLILSMIRFYIVLWNAKQIMCCPRQLWQIYKIHRCQHVLIIATNLGDKIMQTKVPIKLCCFAVNFLFIYFFAHLRFWLEFCFLFINFSNFSSPSPQGKFL